MFYPLAGMLLISMIWSCYWYFAFTKAQEIAAIQRKELAAQGFQFTCGHESWRGFPFRFEFQCEGVTINYANATLKTARVLAVAQAYNPFHILFLVNGPTSVAKDGLPVAAATHDDVLISLMLNGKGDWDVSSDVAHLNVPEILSSASLKLFTRKYNGRIDFAGNTDGLEVRGPNNSHVSIDHAEFLAQASDRASLDITAFTISSGSVKFDGAGKVNLDANHLLAGKLSTQTNDIDGLLRLISPLLEMNDKDQGAIKSLLATQGNSAKSSAQKADFVGRDGAIFWGQFKLTDLRPLY